MAQSETATAASAPLADRLMAQGQKEDVADEFVFFKAGSTMSFAPKGTPITDDVSNLCSPGDGSDFKVRVGPDYARRGKKEFSLSNMYDITAGDCIKTSKRIYPFAPLATLPPLTGKAKTWKHDYVPATFIVNIQIPNSSPKLFNADEDGETLHVILYYQIRDETVDMFQNPDQAAPAHRLWAEWCEKAFTDEKFRGRFKAMGIVKNFTELSIPSLFERFNGKPAIIFKSGSIVRGENNEFMELNINVFTFPFTTRKSIWSLQSRGPKMLIHFGGTIEGRCDEELPERMVFCGHLIRIPAFDSGFLSPSTVSWLEKQSLKRSHNKIVQTAGSDFNK